MSAYATWPEERKEKHRSRCRAWHRATQHRPDQAARRRATKAAHYRANKITYKARATTIKIELKKTLEGWKTFAIQSAKVRANTKGVPFSITASDFSGGTMCPILGVTLVFGGAPWHPHGPSLDRVKPDLGYVPGNVRIISNCGNRLKDRHTLETARNLLKYLED